MRAAAACAPGSGVAGSGLFGRVLAGATDALLAAGALRVAVDRIADELEPAVLVA
jgi:hypothetical protein